MNLKFKYKQSSEFKQSLLEPLKLYSLSSITAVWTTIFLPEEKKIWRKSLRTGKQKVGRKPATEGSLASGLSVVAL